VRNSEKTRRLDKAHPQAPSAPFRVNQVVTSLEQPARTGYRRFWRKAQGCLFYHHPLVSAREELNQGRACWGGIVLFTTMLTEIQRIRRVEKGAERPDFGVTPGHGGHAERDIAAHVVAETAWFDGPLSLVWRHLQRRARSGVGVRWGPTLSPISARPSIANAEAQCVRVQADR